MAIAYLRDLLIRSEVVYLCLELEKDRIRLPQRFCFAKKVETLKRAGDILIKI